MNQDEPPGPPATPGDAWSVLAYLITGLLVWGGAGMLLDRWLGTELFIVVGLLLGSASSIYLVYIRYGRV